MDRIPFSFTCEACELTERRPTPKLPEGWTAEHVEGLPLPLCFCPECSDLEREQERLRQTASALYRAAMPILMAAIGALSACEIAWQISRLV